MVSLFSRDSILISRAEIVEVSLFKTDWTSSTVTADRWIGFMWYYVKITKSVPLPMTMTVVLLATATPA